MLLTCPFYFNERFNNKSFIALYRRRLHKYEANDHKCQAGENGTCDNAGVSWIDHFLMLHILPFYDNLKIFVILFSLFHHRSTFS